MENENTYNEVYQEDVYSNEMENKGYSIFRSSDEFYEQWEKANAIEIKSDYVVCEDILKTKVCKNGNLYIQCKDIANNVYNAFLSPAVASEKIKSIKAVKEIKKTTPDGCEYTSCLEWDTDFLIKAENMSVRIIPSENKKSWQVVEMW